MQRNEDEQLRLLLCRVEELCDRAAHGQLAHTNFLTPRQAKHAISLVRRLGQADRVCLYGGYGSAERACLLLFPDYVVDAFDTQNGEMPQADRLFAYAGEQNPVSALCFTPSGYRTLTHRDYLGSLLSLGIEREMLGDIIVGDERTIVLCRSHMVPYLCSTVERIGGDAVRVSPIELAPDFDGGRKFLPVTDTVASRRLDGVVAALANLSREAAQTAVRSGLVELDYESEMRPDHLVDVPCIISIRGKGKFVVRELGTLTRRGRLRLRADQYV